MNELILILLTFQQKIKFLHWQTTSYSYHNAFGNSYKELDILIDSLVETYIGKYGRLKLEKSLELKIQFNDKELEIIEDIDKLISLLECFDKRLKEKDTDLFNIRDEILMNLNKLKYHLSLS